MALFLVMNKNFCIIQVFFSGSDVVTHIILSPKSQLERNELEAAKCARFFTHFHLIANKTVIKVDGN